MLRLTVLTGALVSTISLSALSHEWVSARPDAHAPISVMGDHTHKTGEVMLSYRHMRMEMNDLFDGDDKISPAELLDNSSYSMVPTKMTMEMDMVGAMYAPTDTTTAMAMLPYIKNNMDMLMSMPMAMTMPSEMPSHTMSMAAPVKTSMKSSGIGDLKLGVLQSLLAEAGQRVHLNLMVSLPTGSIDEEGDNNQPLPYRMQLGSGTYDLMPGITYAAQYSDFSWGGQAQAIIRLDKNDRDYRLGNRYLAQAWIQKPVLSHLAVSGRVAYEKWQNINGDDDDLNPMMSPLADPALQSGDLVSAALGVSATLPYGNRLAVEYTRAVTQNLNGPQMGFDDSIVVAWQFSFK